MKRKYFLRGMGIGIFVTAMLFTIALIFESPTMSEEEIKREAAKLGMVMAQDAASDKSSTNGTYDQDVVDEVEKSASEAKKNEEEAKSQEAEASSEKSSAEEEKDEANETVKRTTTETDTSSSEASSSKSSSKSSSTQAGGESVAFSVAAGENSYTVGAHLFRDGLVDDPDAFDSFLESNGYDNRIQNGDFEIPMGSSYEEIAKILTRE